MGIKIYVGNQEGAKKNMANLARKGGKQSPNMKNAAKTAAFVMFGM